jgi:flagellin-like hook-associated protein FlgL
LTKPIGSNVVILGVSGVAGNDGYKSLFVGTSEYFEDITYKGVGTPTTAPRIEIDYPIDSVIDDTNDVFVFNIGGHYRYVTLPHGVIGSDLDLDTINNAITAQLPTIDIETIKPFDTYDTGGENHSNISANGSYKLHTPVNVSSVGVDIPQGQTGGGQPASVTLPVNISSPFTVNGSNNVFKCIVNGELVTLVLEGKTYATLGELAMHMQSKFDEKLRGLGPDKSVDVTVVNNRLVFTTEFISSQANLEIKDSTEGSSFLRDLCYTPVPAQAAIGVPMKDSIVINGNNSFNFTHNGQNISVNLTDGNYSKEDFAKHLDTLLSPHGVKADITASGGNSYLRFTTTKTGDHESLILDTNTMGDSAFAIFNGLETPASCTINLPVQNSFEINSSTNQFTFELNGVTLPPETLPSGTYDPEKLVNELNSKFAGRAAFSIGSGNLLTITTVATGKSASIRANSDIAGTSQSEIFGTNTAHISGITASTSDDGKKIILEGREIGADKYFSVSSSYSTDPQVFLPAQALEADIPPDVNGGTAQSAFIDGIDISDPVVINDHNNDLSFRYGTGVAAITVNLTLPQQSYSFSQLNDILQAEIDAGIGPGNLTVSVSSTGVRIEAVRGENDLSDMSNFSGGFYNYVMRGTVQNEERYIYTEAGTQTVTRARAIGRQDVNNNSVDIISGLNDELSIDVTIGGVLTKISMILDPGTYQGNSLSTMISGKLSGELIARGYPGDLISVSIGGYSSGVFGSDDDNVLQFSFSDSAQAKSFYDNNPVEYIIDGVAGSASYFVFYKNDGRMVPSYITGTKDISNGVIIEPGKDEFSFTANGVTYNYTIPEGVYDQQGIINTLNTLIQTQSGPNPPDIIAVMSGNNIKLTYTKFGKNSISAVTGSARGEIFYSEVGTIEADHDILIQVSAKANDLVSIDKPRIDTTGLRVNSIVVTNIAHANKALSRLDDALIKVVETREYFGARQNRFDHIRNANDVTAQNLTQSESRIRDADMAKEMMRLTKANVLSQMAQPLLAQANSSIQTVLRLLT